MPSTPYDVKGLLVASVEDENPVIFIDDRWLYNYEGDVPKELYSIEIGKAIVRRKGNDVTIVATSYMVYKAIEAAKILEKEGIDAEIIDLRTVKPMDKQLLYDSVKKTKRLVIADAGWKTCGIGAEISATIAESNILTTLKAPIARVTLPDTPAPASSVLEQAYYPESKDIVLAVKDLLK
jgi:pyruvate dehydrogenase E1 component beta subunit